jgi:hypothetical protein
LLTFMLFLSACMNPSGNAGTTTPESLGISSRAILDFINAAEMERKDEIHSFVLLRHGKIAAQGWWNPYNPESPHMLFSLSKSFTSTAIGIAQSEGLLNINVHAHPRPAQDEHGSPGRCNRAHDERYNQLGKGFLIPAR